MKIIEENAKKKYKIIKTNVFKNIATILGDTLNEHNRYPERHASEQYIPLIADVKNIDFILSSTKVIKIDKQPTNKTYPSNYKKYKRQYSGFINSSGDTILLVCFLEFKKRKEANSFFYNWEYQNSFFGTVLYLHKKSPGIIIYSFNKRAKEIKLYSPQDISF